MRNTWTMKYLKMHKSPNKTLLILLTAVAGMILSHSGKAQQINAAEDMAFLESQTNTKAHFHKRAYMFKEEKRPLVKYNPVSLSLGGLMYLYQNAISQQLSANCLYQPSCSEFSKRSIAHFGIFKGVFLSADRITRCNKIAGLDIHPLTMDEDTHKSKNPIDLYQ